jgi:hypothetical protein
MEWVRERLPIFASTTSSNKSVDEIRLAFLQLRAPYITPLLPPEPIKITDLL